MTSIVHERKIFSWVKTGIKICEPKKAFYFQIIPIMTQIERVSLTCLLESYFADTATFTSQNEISGFGSLPLLQAKTK